MEITLESTDQGIPFDGNPSPFPPFRNIGAPYMATLSLLRFTIGLQVWLFSTSLVKNVVISPQSSTPTRKNQPLADHKVDPLPSSSVVSSSSSSYSPGESIGTSNQVAKEKKKGKKKNKKQI